MSAAPKFPSDLGLSGLRMTAREFLALGETPERLELIDGVVTVSPQPSFRHQRVSFLIAKAIDNWAADHPGAYMAQDVNVQLSPSIVYEPDVVAFAPGRLEREPDRADIVPDLVVELLSPSSKGRDLLTKRDDYERFGVREYWVVDPFTLEVRAFQREGAKLVEARPTAGGTVRSLALPGFVLNISDLRR